MNMIDSKNIFNYFDFEIGDADLEKGILEDVEKEDLKEGSLFWPFNIQNEPTIVDDMTIYTMEDNIKRQIEWLVNSRDLGTDRNKYSYIKAERGADDTMDIVLKDETEKQVGTIKLNLCPDLEDNEKDMRLPNNDLVSDIENYTWKKFDGLKESMQTADKNAAAMNDLIAETKNSQNLEQ